MDKMKFETVDGTVRNVDKIAEMFPQVVTEVLGEDGKPKRAVKWDVLKQLLSGDYVEGGECYEFTWPGKRAAIAEAAKPIRKTLRPCKEESKNWDTTENLYIEGDNLEVLKLLQESYLGKVKMIYIDPPYNTGNDFVYKDNFTKDRETSEDELGLFDEETEARTMSGDLFKNTESNGRFHSDWCSMMYPRLQIAKDLLTENGVIFISIDDNEQENLKKICDEIFGTENFLANLVWKKKYTGGKGTSTFADYHEYILSYAKDKNSLGDISMARPDSEKDKFTQEDEFIAERGKYYTRPLKSNLDPRPTLVYPISLPSGKSVTTQWICAEQTFLKLKQEGRIEFKESGNSKYPVYKKFYENDAGGTVKIPSFIEVSNNNEAKEELKKLFQIQQTRDLPFDTPKPTELLQLFIENFSSDGEVVVDFFSGSSSTAHAVMKLNAANSGKRKFIMVQLPEVCEAGTEAAKAGYKNICEIGKERIRRAGEKIKEEAGLAAADLDIGFRVFKVADSNMKDVYYSANDYSQGMLDGLVSNIKEDRTDLDLLYGCLLEWGVELSLPHTSETIDDVTVHTVDNGALIACFDANIPESAIRTIAKRQPLRAVFRDSSFSSAPQKINVEEIFKLLSPTTTVKVI